MLTGFETYPSRIKVAVAAGHELKNESKMRSATDLMVSDQTPEDAPRQASRKF